jgi:molybdenum cofactor biosynthesis enzyme MoaA
MLPAAGRPAGGQSPAALHELRLQPGLRLTGGEPFLAPDLGAVVEAAARWAPVTILTNAMLLERGSRRRTLESLDPARVTMQVSLDSVDARPARPPPW